MTFISGFAAVAKTDNYFGFFANLRCHVTFLEIIMQNHNQQVVSEQMYSKIHLDFIWSTFQIYVSRIRNHEHFKGEHVCHFRYKDDFYWLVLSKQFIMD